ncbi:hypothetical protein EV421DRAFT_1909374 [Armillaria borealis]|uniref:DUF4470 domain-containing protein n=1 Tax=Armillaria borealis TaxID=47425 RepID=A0AA39MHG5_9AGAR|nr:hypothetical protein EV421DRAFT_1909374 [Armillaria borealis]
MGRLVTASISDAPEKLKERGNELFKGGSFQEAAKFYRQAQESSPEDPIYTSNLSAALYELGDYSNAFNAICLAVTKSDPESPDFLQRLSARMAKCLLYGTIDHNVLSQAAIIVNKLESRHSSKEWKMWRALESEANMIAVGSTAAQHRLLDMNKFKSNLNPTLEFFKIGHDIPMSIVDNWGALHTQNVPLPLKQLSLSKISKLSFLFAGVGDARDLCFLILLDDLVSVKYDEKEQVEIKATLFYSYVGIVMPDYCHKRFQMVVTELIGNLQRDRPRLPAWLHVNAGFDSTNHQLSSILVL